MSKNSSSNLQNTHIQEKNLSLQLQRVFSRLDPKDIEQFTHAYHTWTLSQQIDQIALQIRLTQQKIEVNQKLLHNFQPTVLALSTLAQLQAHGVSNIDLLDRLHARGEAWLDHALQLLEHCERMDMIQGDYTQWCEHALEGAYDWISSIDDEDLSNAENGIQHPAHPLQEVDSPENSFAKETEALLLRKLFGETAEIVDAEPEAELTISSQISPLEQTNQEKTTELADLGEVTKEVTDEEPITEEIKKKKTTELALDEKTAIDTLAVIDQEDAHKGITSKAENPEEPPVDLLLPPQTPTLEPSKSQLESPPKEAEQPPHDNTDIVEEENEETEILPEGIPEQTTTEEIAESPNHISLQETAYQIDTHLPNTSTSDEPTIIITNEQNNGKAHKEKLELENTTKQHGFLRRMFQHFFSRG